MSFITVLTGSRSDRVLTKRVYRDNCGELASEKPAFPFKYNAYIYEYTGIEGLYDRLKAIAEIKNACIIRGRVKSGIKCSVGDIKNPAECVVGDSFQRTQVNLVGNCSEFLCLDIDKIPVPDSLAVAPNDRVSLAENAEQLIEYAVSLLPEEFQAVSYCYGMSSSFLVKTTAFSAHVWFQMDEVGNEAALHNWAKWVNGESERKHGFRLIDPAVFTTNQPHFTADPILDGVALPPFKRHGLILGERDTVTVRFPTRTQRQAVEVISGSPGTVLPEAHSYESAIALLGDGEGLHGFYEPLKSAIGHYVRQFPNCDDADLFSDVCQRIDQAPRGNHTDDEMIDRKRTALKMIVAFKERDRLKIKTGIDGLDEAEIFSRRRFPINEVTKEGAEDKTNREIHKALLGEDVEGVTTLLKAPAGIGKTAGVAEVAALRAFYYIGELGEFYVPTHANAEEFIGKFNEKASKLFDDYEKLVFGQPFTLDKLTQRPVVKKIEPRNEINCILGSRVEEFNKLNNDSGAEAGFYSTHCKKCPQFGVCPYMQQFQTGSASEIHIYQHAHLTIPRITGKNRQPDWIVIDENFVNGCVKIDEDITREGLRQYCDHQPDLEHISDLIFSALLANDLDKLRQTVSLDDLSALREHHENLKRVAMGNLAQGDDKRGFERASEYNKKALAVLTCITPQYKALRIRFNGVLVRDSTRRSKPVIQCENVAVASRKPLARLRYADGSPFTSNTLVLDATAIPEAVEACLGRAVDTVAFDVARNANIYQVTDCTYATSATNFWDRVYLSHERAVSLAKQRQAENKTVGFVAEKSVIIELFREYGPSNRTRNGVVYGHFNALRGLNCWEEMECHDLFVVGRVQPSTDDLDLMAGGLYFDTDEALTPCPEGGLPQHEGLYFYNTKILSESQKASYSEHPDRRANDLLMAIRESEVSQAVDRARLIHNTEVKNIYLFCNIPVRVTVTKLLTERQLLSMLGHTDNRVAVRPASPVWIKRFCPEITDKKARTQSDRTAKDIQTGALAEGYVWRWVTPEGSRRFKCIFDSLQGAVEVLAVGAFGQGVVVEAENV